MTESDWEIILRILLVDFFSDIDTESKIDTDTANAIVSVHLKKFTTLLASATSQGAREAKEELLEWVKKHANKSAMVGVLGYDFVHRIEQKLEHEIYELSPSKEVEDNG